MKHILIIFVMIFFTGCLNSQLSKIDNKDSMTLGTVQKDVKIGMKKSDVLMALGSPNIVSNEGNDETWVYDKISTHHIKSNSSGNIFLLGGVAPILGFGNASMEQSSKTTSQKTLTVILRFKGSSLDKIDYHTSKY